MNRRDLHYNSDVAAVKAVQFGIKSPEQIEKEAVWFNLSSGAFRIIFFIM